METIEVPIAAVAALAAGVAVFAVMVTVMARARRRHAQRLAQALLRLEESPDIGRRGRFERLLSRLEDGIDRAILSRGDAAIAADRMAQALDSVPHGVVVCDDQGSVTWRNQAARRLEAGRHGDAVVERAVQDLLRQALSGHAVDRTLELFGPPRRVLNLTARPLDSGWRTGGAVALVEDVSERHRVETMRRDFVSNISHELKTPIGALAVLAETMADETDLEVAGRLATRMQRESLRVARIIDDLLHLSRIEAEESPVREAVRIDHVVAEAIDRVQSLAHRKGVTVVAPDPAPDVVVVCDQRQVVSAVFNLLENAVKYSPNDATTTVSVSTEDGIVAVAVRDEGVGIPAEAMERIFERFYRVDRGRSRDTGGTGLGLAIVRHVVANHGGEVRVTSKEGEGSVFTLRVPTGVESAASSDSTAA